MKYMRIIYFLLAAPILLIAIFLLAALTSQHNEAQIRRKSEVSPLSAINSPAIPAPSEAKNLPPSNDTAEQIDTSI